MFKRKAEKAQAALLSRGYSVTINDKAKDKPDGWKRGSFVVSVQDKGKASAHEPVSFIALERPFQALRDCDVGAACQEM